MFSWLSSLMPMTPFEIAEKNGVEARKVVEFLKDNVDQVDCFFLENADGDVCAHWRRNTNKEVVNKMGKSTISFYLENELLEKLRKQAKKEDRSVSYTIVKLLEKALGGE